MVDWIFTLPSSPQLSKYGRFVSSFFIGGASDLCRRTKTVNRLVNQVIKRQSDLLVRMCAPAQMVQSEPAELLVFFRT